MMKKLTRREIKLLKKAELPTADHPRCILAIEIEKDGFVRGLLKKITIN